MTNERRPQEAINKLKSLIIDHPTFTRSEVSALAEPYFRMWYTARQVKH